MAKRKGSHSHYELMFENFLRDNNFLYIAINEAKRPVFNGEAVKNFDFIVVSKSRKLILIDIKGKKFRYESGYSKTCWENWIGIDDGKFLTMWNKIFGNKTTAILTFAYLIKHEEDKKYFKDIYTFKRNKYGLVAIEIDKYLKNSKPRSKSGKGTFNAIYVSREKFPELVEPLSNFIQI